MAKWISVLCSLAAGAATVLANDPGVTFSSAYTDLSKERRWANSESELSPGQDNALLCKGIGKYQVYLFFSATNSWLSVRIENDPEAKVLDSAIGGVDEEKGVVEWRMANGVPFAIIVKSRQVPSPEEDGKAPRELLVVRGLGRYSKISGSVQLSDETVAAERARKLADDGYDSNPISEH